MNDLEASQTFYQHNPNKLEESLHGP